ncbi:MAG: hypothetical protein LBR37_01820 [Erysipelotrichaceae bacterium]|jgi:hypothetical protein|nr:hypothetical protein [Erysipelotrichaceae bacterium]
MESQVTWTDIFSTIIGVCSFVSTIVVIIYSICMDKKREKERIREKREFSLAKVRMFLTNLKYEIKDGQDISKLGYEELLDDYKNRLSNLKNEKLNEMFDSIQIGIPVSKGIGIKYSVTVLSHIEAAIEQIDIETNKTNFSLF